MGGKKGLSEGIVTGHVSGTRTGFAVPDSWVKDACERNSRHSRGRRRGNIWPPVAGYILQLSAVFSRKSFSPNPDGIVGWQK
jgi:hypothetical protein